MADILVTGAHGQLGWEVARRGAGLSLHALGHGDLDITDRLAVMQTIARLKPKIVINAAAYTAVDRAENDADAAYAVNRDGPAHLAAACAEVGIPLIHISTDYVFDGSKSGAYKEDDPVAPLGIYGKSKLAGEEAVREHLAHHVILRTAWVYGIHGHNFVKTMLRVGAERDTLRVVDDQRGCPTFAGDLADATLAIARQMINGTMRDECFGTFHCTGSGATSWYGFARKIFELAKPSLQKVPTIEAITTAEYPTPAKRPANSVLDCHRLEQAYGIRLRSWEAALAEMLNTVLVDMGETARP
nr:dTDP-4-dehydrorhamnose reductase [Telmatospirillum sp. J64-1]